MHVYLQVSFAVAIANFRTSLAAICNLKPSYPAPVLTDGWQAQLVAEGLESPRSVLFDSSGNLLVVQQGAGIVHLQFDDGGSTCLDVSRTTYLVNSTSVRKRPFQLFSSTNFMPSWITELPCRAMAEPFMPLLPTPFTPGLTMLQAHWLEIQTRL